MQGENPPRPGGEATEQWKSFLTHCIRTRLEPDKFEEYAPLLQAKHPLSPAAVADVCLCPQPFNQESLDPRVLRYIHALSHLKLIDTPSILKALYKYSTSNAPPPSAANAPQSARPHPRWASSYSTEEVIFYRLTKAVGMGTGIQGPGDALQICAIMAKWMTLFTTASALLAHDVMGQLQSAQLKEEMEAARAAFVMLLLNVCDNIVIRSALGRPSAKGVRKLLSESLAVFVPSIMQGASQIATRLEMFRTETLSSFEPDSKKKDGSVNQVAEMLDSAMALDGFAVSDMPIANSRAGLYIYLNAAMVGRPLLDDAAFFGYLNNRYQGDIQHTAIDLILASFDVLANSVFRSEARKDGHLLRCYLINKVPLLLATLAPSMFPPCTPQYCITEALSQVDTNAFPTLSGMFDDSNNNNSFTETVRQDFCFSCCLHGLIPESSISDLLGEITYQSLPTGGKYVKENLVQQCMTDPERIQQLVGELDNMDGNVGAVCQALTEVIGRLCQAKETMILKQLCSQLAKKPLSLDVMLLFDKPSTILRPLCDLLDNWHYEEDQGEYQPVYEEFGFVLLLLLAFVHRYNLSPTDLAIQSPDSFVTKLLNTGQLDKVPDQMTDQEKSNLDGWIRGLFDDATGGLGDDLMSSCPPQDFHLLVPTLFRNMIIATGANCLDDESLQTGIEYLVDTFLLTSLVTAILYMSAQLWAVVETEKKAIIKILHLILTKQCSNEAQEIRTAVINIVAKTLEHSLRSYQRQNPSSQEIEPLLKTIKDNTNLSRRTAGAGHNELENWTSTANGGLEAAVRQTTQHCIQWSLHPGINIMPTSYTHRQILAALKILGAKRLLNIILEEVKRATEDGSGSVAHDVAVALICAPDVTNLPPPALLSLAGDPEHPYIPPQTRISLRGALRFEAEDCKIIQKSDPVMAEIVVRLHRKVEAQLVMPEPPTEMLQSGMDLHLGDNATAGIDDALAAAQNDGMNVDEPNMGLDLGGPGNDMNLGGMGDHGAGLDLGGDDDIFGGLGGVGGNDLLDGWDSQFDM